MQIFSLLIQRPMQRLSFSISTAGASAGEIPAAVQGSVLQSVRCGKVLVLVSPVRGSVGSKAKC